MGFTQTRVGRIRAAVATVGVAAVGLAAVSGLAGAAIPVAANAAAPTRTPTTLRTSEIASTGLKPGAIKHVWLIILENKSYDATFTGLNQNSYLWKTLPSQGVLLKNYYGTGHYSMDNYISLVSGQAPQQDTQSDCSVKNFDIGTNASIVHTGGSLKKDKNFGQVSSPANASQPSGANAANGLNGCSYPTDVPTLFNQLDAAGKTWKGYAQDLHNQPGREDAVCGGPGLASNNPSTNPTYLTAAPGHPLPAGVVSFTGAQPNDQYVAKHFPFSWFHALTGKVQADGKTTPGLTKPVGGGSDCGPNHIANLDSPSRGLFHDLKKASTTPAFSWITPNNCSDAHDAICKGNNLSGSFAGGKPVYQHGTPDPESTTPKNYTGGLYSADLFLRYYIPLVEKSPAFKQGGLIDITFDEANPPFTYSGNSFNNANAYGPTLGVEPNASTSIVSDLAGENISGRNVHREPTGPNSTLGKNAQGQELYPGPGDNAFIDRPPVCTATKPKLVPATCVPGIVEGGADSSPTARTDAVAADTASTYVRDDSILADDSGRIVTDTADRTGPGGTSPIPAGTFVGAVSDTGPRLASSPKGSIIDGSFQLVNSNGTPVTPTGAVSAITLSAEGEPGHLTTGETADPLFDADDATPGGGDTGSVLISPLIHPGTVSTRFYNHYSWLATMEDLFDVSAGHDHAKLPAGTVSGGLDGLGHLGYAAQPGLTPFGRDVFNNPSGRTSTTSEITPVSASVLLGSSMSTAAAAELPKAALPTAGVRPDSVLTGSTAEPAVTSQGDTVRVALPAATVLATVTGPQVPGEGFPFVAPATTCTWTVRLTGATRRIPIDVADFDSIDSFGTVYRAALVPGQPRPPSSLAPGQTVTFELRAVMKTGEGLMRWAPDGRHIEAKWDFEVEND